MHDLLVMPVRDKDYYDNLLKELDERYAIPYSSAVKVVPPLELRKALHSRGFSRGSNTTRPNTAYTLTSTRPNTARSLGDPLDRETRRIEYLCERDAKQTFKSPRPDSIIEKLRGPQLIGKELYAGPIFIISDNKLIIFCIREIERALMEPYRSNPDKYRTLLERVNRLEMIKKNERRPVTPANTNKQVHCYVYNEIAV